MRGTHRPFGRPSSRSASTTCPPPNGAPHAATFAPPVAQRSVLLSPGRPSRAIRRPAPVDPPSHPVFSTAVASPATAPTSRRSSSASPAERYTPHPSRRRHLPTPFPLTQIRVAPQRAAGDGPSDQADPPVPGVVRPPRPSRLLHAPPPPSHSCGRPRGGRPAHPAHPADGFDAGGEQDPERRPPPARRAKPPLALPPHRLRRAQHGDHPHSVATRGGFPAPPRTTVLWIGQALGLRHSRRSCASAPKPGKSCSSRRGSRRSRSNSCSAHRISCGRLGRSVP